MAELYLDPAWDVELALYNHGCKTNAKEINSTLHYILLDRWAGQIPNPWCYTIRW